MEAPLAAMHLNVKIPHLPEPVTETIEAAARLCRTATRPVILAGGGAVWADEAITALANALDAPVITTANARGIMAGHRLCVPASPSLEGVRTLIRSADLTIAIGTQLGPTDYDVYEDGGFVPPGKMIRIDLDPNAHIPAELRIVADARRAASALAEALSGSAKPDGREDGGPRAAAARQSARDALPEKMHALLATLDAIRDTVPGAVLVGDSTQIAYAGNLYFEAAAPRSWFNAATGYGSLGFGPPAAIGAAIALGNKPVICMVGDGGFQFCLGALGTAAEEMAPVIFLVWNNRGYQEIEDYMLARNIEPIGVWPGAPDFVKIAEAYGIAAQRVELAHGATTLTRRELELAPLTEALKAASRNGVPALIEVITP